MASQDSRPAGAGEDAPSALNQAGRRQATGRRGEQLAAEFLARRGYTVVARNYRCPWGELDLVAFHDDTWAFVEVRTRRGSSYGPPEASLTARKRAHLVRAAQHYLQAQALADVAWQIDLVAVSVDAAGIAHVRLFENVVSGP